MIRLPSVQKPFHAFFSGDDAFEQAPATPDKGATEEQIEAFKKDAEAYLTKLKNARETGDWSALRNGNGEPVKFLLRPMPFDAYAVLTGMQERKEPSEDIFLLAFKLCVTGVEGLGKHEVTFEHHERFGRIASLAWLDKACMGAPALAWNIAFEIGAVALARAHLGPL